MIATKWKFLKTFLLNFFKMAHKELFKNIQEIIIIIVWLLCLMDFRFVYFCYIFFLVFCYFIPSVCSIFALKSSKEGSIGGISVINVSNEWLFCNILAWNLQKMGRLVVLCRKTQFSEKTSHNLFFRFCIFFANLMWTNVFGS